MSRLDFVDVSHHNGKVPWNRFRDAGVKGGICKVNDGYFMPPNYTTHIDPQFKHNWQALNTFDLRGGYGFTRFDANKSGGLTPAKQVKLQIDTIGDHKETDILVLDNEQSPAQIAHISLLARAHMLEDAFKEAEKHWDKEYIWNYTAKWWWNYQMPAPHVEPMPYLLSFKCWAAYYTILNLSARMVPDGWELKDVIAHQYSAKKQIEGIVVDHNEFKYDWNSYLKLDIEPTPPEPEPPPPEPVPPPEPTPTPTPPIPNPDAKGCLGALIDIIINRNKASRS